MNPIQRKITADTILWGIRDRADGAKVAQGLTEQVQDQFSRTPAGTPLPQTQVVASLKQEFSKLGLQDTQSKTAMMLAGAMLGGPSSALWASASQALSSQSLAEVAQKAARMAETPTGKLMGELSASVEQRLSSSGLGANSLSEGLFAAGSIRGDQVTQEIKAWKDDRNNPQAGLACGSFIRPEALFSEKTQNVICTARSYANPTGLEEVKVGKLNVVNMDQFFNSKNEVLLGFGKPNVFTLIPPKAEAEKQTYQKLDAYMFFRKKTQVTSASVAQSGVFLRPRNLPAEAVEVMRSAMQEQVGKRGISCAKSNAAMLTRAGFTSGGEELSGEFRPQKLFMHIVKHGLEFQGKPVKFDVINTTPGTIEEHFRAVLKKERSSPLRAIEKIFKKDVKSADEIEGLKQAKSLKAVEDPQVPLLAGAPIRIRNSRPAALMTGLRQIWGQHILWEAIPDKSRVDVDKFLPGVLQDKFTLAKQNGEKMSKVDRLKNIAFSKPMIARMRKGLAKHFDEMGQYQPGQIKSMLPVAAPGEEAIKFNLVICGPKVENRVSITRIDGGAKAADWVLSKHVLVSGYDPDVRFAGEIWGERYTAGDGSEQMRIHVNNNSGTYRPSGEQVQGAAAYLRELFPNVEVVAHVMEQEPPKATAEDHQKTFAVQAGQLGQLRQNLDGRKITLHDDQGKAQDFTIRRFKTVELDTEYFDTPDKKLLETGGLLRARTRLAEPGSDKVKDIELEAKLPTQGGTARVKGATFDEAAEWSAQRGEILTGQGDKAVQLARYAAGKNASFEPVAWKNTSRELYLVSPDKPLGIGRLQPSFVLSLDTSSVRDQAAKPEGEVPTWNVLEPQVFTKLPWTKTVTTGRLAQFEDLSRQLLDSEGLKEAPQAGYADAMQHLRRPS